MAKAEKDLSFLKWEEKDSMVKVKHKSWCCECGCNVGKFDVEKVFFKCNSCKTIYKTK